MLKTYLTIALLIVFSVCLAYSALQNNAHVFSDDQCVDCHAMTPVKGKRETLRMTASIEMLCRRCHKKKSDPLSHPVEVMPGTIVPPADLPLSWEGKLTCATCHDIHSSPYPGFDDRWYYLRRAVTGRAFCEACHQESAIAQENGGSHTRDLGMAHMRYTEGTGGSIDKVSQACLSCHDETMVSRTNVKAGMWQHGKAFPSDQYNKGNHPIGISYRRAAKKGVLLKPREQLNPKIRLIDGKIGCTSCHDIYSKLDKMLVMPIDNSSLCIECHGNI